MSTDETTPTSRQPEASSASRERSPFYKAYMRSERWQRRRKAFMWTRTHCGICYRPKHAQMHVHHLHYRNLGHEDNRDLLMVCQRCHQAIHQIGKLEHLTIPEATARMKRLVLIYGRNVAKAYRVREHADKHGRDSA